MRGAAARARERGAATLETVGVAIIATVLVVGLLLAVSPQARVLSGTMSYWICQVVTFGQGGCSRPTSAADHHPTDPCVLTSDGVERNQKISVIVFTSSDGRRIEVQKLSNGQYRVTESKSGGAGAEVGVGGGISLTVNDTTVGGSATAGAGASIDIKDGRVYYTDKAGLNDLMNGLLEDQVKDEVVGDGGPTRWLTDQITGALGLSHDLPTPDETYAEGGISLNASAEATALTDHAGAGVSAAQVLGVRTAKDGSRTIYLSSTVEGEAGLQSLGVDTSGARFEGAKLEGKLQVVTAVTFDGNGNMTRTQMTATAAGTSSGIASALFGGSSDTALSNQVSNQIVWQATLPIKDAADQAVAGQFLLTQGVGSLGAWVNPAVGAAAIPATVLGENTFLHAVRDHGYLTQQTYSTENNTVFGFDASGELGIELGVSADVSTDSMTTTGAQYWDGTGWVDWQDCAA